MNILPAVLGAISNRRRALGGAGKVTRSGLIAVADVAVSGDGSVLVLTEYNADKIHWYTKSGATWSYAGEIATAEPRQVQLDYTGALLVALRDGATSVTFTTFERTGSSWSQVNEQTEPENEAVGGYGFALSSDGALLAAPGWCTEEHAENGQRYIWTYERSGPGWVRVDAKAVGQIPWSDDLYPGGITDGGKLVLYHADWTVSPPTSTSLAVETYARSGVSWSLESSAPKPAQVNSDTVDEFIVDKATGTRWIFGHGMLFYSDPILVYDDGVLSQTLVPDTTAEDYFGQGIGLSSDGVELAYTWRLLDGGNNSFGFYYRAMAPTDP